MLTPEELKKNLLKLAQPICDEAGMDLIELNVRRHGGEVAVQVLADRPAGGISMEECSFLNRKLVETLDAQLAISQEYSLEVSSPGLDRALTTKKDFLRAVHQELRFHLSGPVGGKREYTGILTQVSESTVLVETQKYGEITIPIGNILKAVQVF